MINLKIDSKTKNNIYKDYLIIQSLLFILTFPLRAQEFPDNLDIIIIVDVSGSMEFALNGNNPVPVPQQRLTFVRPGLNALATVIQRLTDPVPSGGGGVSTRRFSIGRFPGNAPNDFSWLEQNPANNSNLRNYNETELNNIISALNIRWAGTPIGTAIIDAITMFNNFPYTGIGSTGSVILLFTDGKRHGGEPIYKPGLGSGSVNNVREAEIRDHIDHSSVSFDDNRIKIVSLGFGDLSTASSETDFDMLDDISVVAAGRYDPIAESEAGFTKRIIYNAFSSMGYGAALSDPSFLLSPGETQEHVYPVTEYDQRLLFMVSWSEPKADSTIEFTIRDALGQLINPVTARQNTYLEYDVGETFQMYTIEAPYFQNNLGMWTLIVNGDNIVSSENYSYSILGHSALQLRDALNRQQLAQYTGDKIQLQVSLTGDGNLIPNAIVTAQVSGPEIGAGNWFAEFPLTPPQLDSVRGIQFPGFVEDVYKKFYYMNRLNNVALPGTNSFEIKLTYDQQDSLYKGESTPLSRPGIYELMVTATNDSLDNANPFKRDLPLNYNVKVKPNLDWTISSLEFQKLNNEELNKYDIYRLKFTPKDQFQNFVKPGKAENINFHVENATLTQQPIVDDLQGSYYKDIQVPTNTLNPTVTVQFRDFMFEERPITVNPKRDNWRFYPNALSLHGGAVIPIGTTDSLFSSDLHAAIDYYRQLNRNWAINAIAGYSKFIGKENRPDIEYWNFSLNLRWYLIVQPAYRFFLNAGGGYYLTDRSSNSNFGYNAGVGINIPIFSRIDLEIGSDYHNIILDLDNFTFIRAYGGLLIRF